MWNLEWKIECDHVNDNYISPTSTEQEEVEISIKEIYKNVVTENTEPALYKNQHIKYLKEGNCYLTKGLKYLPGHFTSLDASKPWLIYWIIQSLDILKEEIDLESQQRFVLR